MLEKDLIHHSVLIGSIVVELAQGRQPKKSSLLYLLRPSSLESVTSTRGAQRASSGQVQTGATGKLGSGAQALGPWS
ncbi:hypothetical protein CapIbe_009195 [Capra ibex]